MHAAVEGLDAADRGGHVGGLGVVRRRGRRPPSPTSSRRCGTPAKLAQRLAHRRQARCRCASAAADGAHGVLQVVRPAQPDLLRADQGSPRQTRAPPSARGRRRAAEAHVRRHVHVGRRDRHVVGSLAAKIAELGLAVAPRSCRGGRGGPRRCSAARAHSGANADVSSSWKLDASQTTTASGSTSPTSDASGVPTLPATATGTPARASDRARAAPPSWSCRWCRSRPGTGSAAAARPAPARRAPRSRAPARPAPPAPRAARPGS